MKKSINLYSKCDYPTTARRSLAKHQRVLHEGVKNPCGKFDYQVTQNGNLAEHQWAYHCKKCDYQETKNGNLVERQREVHEDIRRKSG